MNIDNFERIAVFIDADNAQAAKIEDVLKDVSAYGRIVTKRAYANWTKPSVKPWEKEVKRFAIATVQQFDFASGKNASDMALTIDAMELLHTGNYDCFIIVSSDSDFTTLAIKLHESGVFVIGYGNKQTVESFRNACDEFNYVDDLGDNIEDGNLRVSEQKEENTTILPVEESSNTLTNIDSTSESSNNSNCIEGQADSNAGVIRLSEEELDTLLCKAEDKYAGDDGYVNVSSAGTYIKRVHSDFNIKSFGYDKLPEYLRAKSDQYDVVERQGKGVVKLILYKSKKNSQ